MAAMSSERKIRANRINARASSGAKTPAGRARAARNARRHGLNVPVHTDPTCSSRIAELAGELAGSVARPGMQELALELAEAQVDLQRARGARYDLLVRLLGGRRAEGAKADDFGKLLHQLLSRAPEDPQNVATLLDGWIQQRLIIDRYIRRAYVRRKLAIIAFQRFVVNCNNAI